MQLKTNCLLATRIEKVVRVKWAVPYTGSRSRHEGGNAEGIHATNKEAFTIDQPAREALLAARHVPNVDPET